MTCPINRPSLGGRVRPVKLRHRSASDSGWTGAARPCRVPSEGAERGIVKSTTTGALAWGLVAVACTVPGAPAELDEIEGAATVCGDGPTVKGIDVSYYQ